MTEVLELSTDQQRIYNHITGTNRNTLVIGKPGVGKSVLIRALANSDNGKYYHLAAPTGLAAINIGNAKTLHSLFGIPTSEGIITPDYNLYPTNQRVLDHLQYRLEHLIIDEISMVRADTFDFIDRVLRFAKGVNLPFGGVQIIAIGDFFQLPPVTRALEKRQLKEHGYASPFMFDSKCFKDFDVLQLTEVLRQKGDPNFIEFLDHARDGSLTPKQVRFFHPKVGKPNDIRIEVTCTNATADKINQLHLMAINEPAYTFTGIKEGEWPALPVPEIVEIKVGAQVMVKVNRADINPLLTGKKLIGVKSRAMNGTLGVVAEVVLENPDENDELFLPHVKLRLDDGTIVPIYTKTWERKIKVQENGKYRERVIASYEQMPLALAWAISIHKSQGQSFDKVHINLKQVFEAGQAYVAFSRCRSSAGISLEVPAATSHFWASPAVINFIDSI